MWITFWFFTKKQMFVDKCLIFYCFSFIFSQLFGKSGESCSLIHQLFHGLFCVEFNILSELSTLLRCFYRFRPIFPWFFVFLISRKVKVIHIVPTRKVDNLFFIHIFPKNPFSCIFFDLFFHNLTIFGLFMVDNSPTNHPSVLIVFRWICW